MQKKIKTIIIGGPTGIGKTSLSIELAEMIGGQLVNADSRQVYKYVDIGTNKGTISKASRTFKCGDTSLTGYYIEDSDVVGWMFDIIEPDEYFSVADFQFIAKSTIEKISQTSIPIVIGGTGLYIDSLIKDYDIPKQEPDLVRRKELGTKSVDELHELINEIGGDIRTLNNSDKHNPRRLIRIVERLNQEIDISNANQESDIIIEPYFIYPKYDIAELEKNITTRVERMIAEGLIEEVRDLANDGYENTQLMKGMGYKEVLMYLHGEITEESELIQKISTAHLQYAKKQRTWFEGEGRAYDLNIFDFETDKDLILEKLEEFFEEE